MKSAGISRQGRYSSRASLRLLPRERQFQVPLPNETPPIVTSHLQHDDQALLAIVRYNRILDAFVGMPTCSVRNYARRAAGSKRSIDIAEIFVGTAKDGGQFAILVQGMAERSRLDVAQAKRDIVYCTRNYPSFTCRLVVARFVAPSGVAMFELAMDDGEVQIAREAHYRLVPAKDIGAKELASYRTRRS